MYCKIKINAKFFPPKYRCFVDKKSYVSMNWMSMQYVILAYFEIIQFLKHQYMRKKETRTFSKMVLKSTPTFFLKKVFNFIFSSESFFFLNVIRNSVFYQSVKNSEIFFSKWRKFNKHYLNYLMWVWGRRQYKVTHLCEH